LTGPRDPIGPDAAGRLELADWRRRVADLYAAVRETSKTDPESAWARWRTTRERLYREHPQSPVPPVARASFRGRHWPYDPAWRFEVPVRVGPTAPAEAHGTGIELLLPVSTGDALSFTRLGDVHLPLPGGERTLTIYWMAGYAGGLFLPFRDATNGTTTYGAGRYLLDAAKSADLGGDPERGSLILDFNFAYHPSCAFDPRWSCPLAPPENRLDVAVEAGERLR
jgi:uncharacterized protein (DUF1684 family)